MYFLYLRRRQRRYIIEWSEVFSLETPKQELCEPNSVPVAHYHGKEREEISAKGIILSL
nr:MAG TPA: hypothetical protein [Caudoviricetes sp.]